MRSRSRLMAWWSSSGWRKVLAGLVGGLKMGSSGAASAGRCVSSRSRWVWGSPRSRLAAGVLPGCRRVPMPGTLTMLPLIHTELGGSNWPSISVGWSVRLTSRQHSPRTSPMRAPVPNRSRIRTGRSSRAASRSTSTLSWNSAACSAVKVCLGRTGRRDRRQGSLALAVSRRTTWPPHQLLSTGSTSPTTRTAARTSTIAGRIQLATDLPAAVLAKMLGIHISVAVAWQRASSGDWAAYAADISLRHRGSIPN
jgi:hypothetical protein